MESSSNYKLIPVTPSQVLADETVSGKLSDRVVVEHLKRKKDKQYKGKLIIHYAGGECKIEEGRFL